MKIQICSMGKSLRLGGSRKIYENNDHYFGDLSAILIDNLPVWAELISTPNNEISLMDKWDEKIAAIIKGTLQEDVRSLAGVPSWMLTLLNKLLETTGKNTSMKYGKIWRFIFTEELVLSPTEANSITLFQTKNLNIMRYTTQAKGFLQYKIKMKAMSYY